MPGLRMSLPTLLMLRALAERGDQALYGYELMRRTELKSGTLYPILTRLERHGYLASEWEAVDPAQAGRPARRVYTLTPEGHTFAQAELRKAQQALGGLTHA